jgi:molybdopterin-synthase adenylyltransferase
MNDDDLLRYSRHILLPNLDIAGQTTLLNAHALIIGLGGLGCPAALYLAAAGVGTLTLVDFDRVDLSNLQRQIAHRTQDIGRAKVDSARDALLALNPNICVNAINQAIDANALAALIANADIVLDACDNFATRFAINQACVTQNKPLISGAAIRWEGQITCFDTRQPASACYHCLYPELHEQEESCSANGVVAPLVGIIGSMMALETIKKLCTPARALHNTLLIYDALTAEWRRIKLQRDPHCPSCQHRPTES